MTWIPEDMTAQIDGITDTFSTTFERNLGKLVVTHIDGASGVSRRVPPGEFTELNSVQVKLNFTPSLVNADKLSIEYDTDEILSGRVVGLPEDPGTIPPPVLPVSLESRLQTHEATLLSHGQRITVLETTGPGGPTPGNWRVIGYTAQTNGQTVYSIPTAPRSNNAVAVAFLGDELVPGTHFSVAGSIVTLIQSSLPPIEVGDTVVIKWQE